MTKSLQAPPQKLIMVKKERRAKQIRITDKTYSELAKLGDVTDDFEDVVAKLLRFWKEHHHKGNG